MNFFLSRSTMGDRKSDDVFVFRLHVQMHVEQIEVGSHFVSLSRKFTSFWFKNLASFSRTEDMRSIKLACQQHFLICYYY